MSDSCMPIDCGPPSSYSPGKNTGLVAISFSSVSSWPRDQTWVSCVAGRFFTPELRGKKHNDMVYSWAWRGIVVVQSLSCVRLFAALCPAAHQASLSFTISRSLLKLMSTALMTPSNHLILCRPLLLLPSIFPNVRVFSNGEAWLLPDASGVPDVQWGHTTSLEFGTEKGLLQGHTKRWVTCAPKPQTPQSVWAKHF